MSADPSESPDSTNPSSGEDLRAADSGSEGTRAHERLPRAFSLKRQALIRALFDRDRDDVRTRTAGCIRILYRTVPRSEVGGDVPVQVGFSVPRRTGGAVVRNRIKRLMRETYRHRQVPMLEGFGPTDRTLTMMVLFRGDARNAESCVREDLATVLGQVAADLARVDAGGERNLGTS